MAMIYHVEFLSLKGTLSFDLTSSDPDTFGAIVNDLIACFVPLDVLAKEKRFEGMRVNTPEHRAAIETFVLKWKHTLPGLQGLPAFFRTLDEGEHFIALPNVEVERKGRMGLYMQLQALAEGVPLREIQEPFFALVGDLLNRYKIWSWGDVRQRIGQPDRTLRRCRFCGRRQPNVTFTQEAHAVSEALGNKTLIVFDECDTCNAAFASGIETDVVELFAHYLLFHGVKGKQGPRAMKGANFEARHSGAGAEITLTEGEPHITETEYVLRLSGGKPFSTLNAYNSLCKYFLSLIPEAELPFFSQTIDWINGALTFDDLPPVTRRQNARFSMQPTLTWYQRLDGDARTPYAVVEFQLTSLTLVVIVPGCSKDDRTFSSTADFVIFWDAFKHYGNGALWDIGQMADPERRRPERIFRFQIPPSSKPPLDRLSTGVISNETAD